MATSLENIDKSKVSSTRIEGLTEAIQEELSTSITGAASTIVTSDLTANRAVISNANGKVSVSSTTSTELGYVHGVTSAIQTQLGNKQDTLVSGTNIKTVNNTSLLGSGNVAVQATITGAATTVTSSNLTANRALISDASGKIAVSSITSTKLGYLSDVTSNIQAQINNCSQAIVGSIIPYAGSSIPSGYLLCDGSAISRTTYNALFQAIGTTYGAGDGNSTFNIPVLKDAYSSMIPFGTHYEITLKNSGELYIINDFGFLVIQGNCTDIGYISVDNTLDNSLLCGINGMQDSYIVTSTPITYGQKIRIRYNNVVPIIKFYQGQRDNNQISIIKY